MLCATHLSDTVSHEDQALPSHGHSSERELAPVQAGRHVCLPEAGLSPAHWLLQDQRHWTPLQDGKGEPPLPAQRGFNMLCTTIKQLKVLRSIESKSTLGFWLRPGLCYVVRTRHGCLSCL